MFSDAFKARIRQGAIPIGLALGSVGLSPNVVTFIGLALNFGVGVVLATGNLTLGGILLLPVAAFDMLDGALARATKQTTTFGAFLDSTLDRYAEAIVFLALLVAFTPQASPAVNVAIFAATVGSLLVSYTRARAEGLGLKCEVGLLPRPERIILLAIGLIFGWTMPVVWLLAVLTNFTAGQRIWHVYKSTGGK